MEPFFFIGNNFVYENKNGIVLTLFQQFRLFYVLRNAAEDKNVGIVASELLLILV